MDGIHVEPADGLHEDQSGVQALLRRADGPATPSDGPAELRRRIRTDAPREGLELPLKWKKPQTIFVNSMSDLFHKDVPVEFIVKTFDVMRRADWHHFQVLTKRSERLLEISPDASVGAAHLDGRERGVAQLRFPIDHLRKTGALVKFLSLEPLLGPLPGLNLEGIDWVIAGGESGPGARPMDPAWVLDIRDQCLNARVPFFFKQWGGARKKKSGRELEGRTWDEMPALVAIQGL